MKNILKGIFLLVLLSLSVFSQERNSINLFGKELKFGASTNEFEIAFPEFSADVPEGDTKQYKFRTNYDNAFDNYWMTAKFKNDKLSCLELNGWQTNEYMKILNETLKQMTFDKTVTEKNADVGEISSDFYHKDDLKAEYFNFETAVLTICLKK